MKIGGSEDQRMCSRSGNVEALATEACECGTSNLPEAATASDDDMQ